MIDPIDRQAAIDVEGIDEQIRCEMCRNPMHTDRGCDGGCKYDEKLYEKIMQILDERIKPLPSVQSEREKGKWVHGREVYREYTGTALIMVQYSHWECSVCGYQTENEPLWNFCPHCGARMEVKNDE